MEPRTRIKGVMKKYEFMQTLVIGVATILAAGTARASETAVEWNLAEVRRIALERNPDLKSARANYEAASKVVGQSLSEYLPHVDVSAKFEESTLPSPSAGSTGLLGTAEPYTAAVISVRQTLFDFGRALNQIEASVALSHSAEQDAISVRNIVALNVYRAFFDVSATEKLVSVAQKSVERFMETHRRTEVLVRTGAKPKFDLSQSNVELAKAKLALVNAQNAREIARITLLNLMGMPQTTDFTLAEIVDTKDVESSQLGLKALTQKALLSRPELKRAEFATDAARYSFQSEVRNYFPVIAAQGWYGKYLPNYPESLRDSWGAGVGISWHIFEGMRTSFRTGELSARVDQQQAQLEKQRQNISAEVSASFMSLVQSEDNYKIAKEAEEYSQENLRFAKKRYEASVGTILELLIAEASLVNAEAVAVQARYHHEISIATLERAVNAPLKEE
jgi:outer membrane protein